MKNDQLFDLLQEEEFLKSSMGRYVIYDRQWLLKHLDEEYETLKMVRDSKGCAPLTKEDIDNFLEEMKRHG